MNVEHELDAAFPAFLSLPPQLGRYVAVTELFRQLAVGSLLLTADPRLFFAYLSRSAHAFLDALEVCPSPEILTSKFLPFLDAVACRDEQAAGRIAASAPDAHRRDQEYEEDFLYLKLLMDLYLGNVGEISRARLDRYEVLVTDCPDSRFGICAALWNADPAAFDEAIDVATAERVEESTAAIAEDTMDPDEAAFAVVSVEVLAWIELAQRVGLPVRDSYPLAPEVARAFHLRGPVEEAGWRRGRHGV